MRFTEETRNWIAGGAAIALLAGLVGCGTPDTPAQTAPASAETETPAPDPIALAVRTDVHFTGASLPLVAGVETGIFARHGLDVTLNEGKGSATTIQTVDNGSDQIGYVDAATLVQSVAQGIEVTMVAGMIQSSPLAIFAFEESGIRTPPTSRAGPPATPRAAPRRGSSPPSPTPPGSTPTASPSATSTSPPAPRSSWPGPPTSPSGC